MFFIESLINNSASFINVMFNIILFGNIINDFRVKILFLYLQEEMRRLVQLRLFYIFQITKNETNYKKIYIKNN